MKTLTFLLAVSALSLAACGSSEPPPPDTAAKPLPNSNVFSSDVRALQKAKDVQKTVDQQKQKTDEQLQEAEGH
jgi:hypothetical protein